MTHQVDQPIPAQSAAPACPAAPSRRRFLRAGLGSGLLGGVCCLGSALAIGAGVGGLSFFSTWMERYQVYFVVASVLVMVLWLVRQARRHARGGFLAFARVIWRQLLVMGAVYAVTLGIAMAVVEIVEL